MGVTKDKNIPKQMPSTSLYHYKPLVQESWNAKKEMGTITGKLRLTSGEEENCVQHLEEEWIKGIFTFSDIENTYLFFVNTKEYLFVLYF